MDYELRVFGENKALLLKLFEEIKIKYESDFSYTLENRTTHEIIERVEHGDQVF